MRIGELQLQKILLGVSSLLMLVPAWGAGKVMYLILLLEAAVFFVVASFSYRSLLSVMAAITIMVSIFLIQANVYQGSGEHIYTLVSNPAYRDVIALGNYPVNGDVSVYHAIKFFIGWALIAMVVANRKALGDEYICSNIKFLVVASCVLQFSLLLFVEAAGGRDLLIQLVGQGGSGANNHLTQDSYGTRLSLGFYEPSQMSLFVGGVLGIYTILFKAVHNRVFVAGSLILFFLTSRSPTVVIFFIVVVSVFALPKSLVIAGSVALGFVILNFYLLKEHLAALSVFRSLHERTHFPEFDDLGIWPYIIGVDYGQVYSFIPLIGLIVQFGVVGVFACCWILKFDFRLLLVCVILFSVAPQTWFSMQYMLISYLIFSRFRVEKRGLAISSGWNCRGYSGSKFM